MLELEDNKQFLYELLNKLESIRDSIKLESLKNELKELENKVNKEDFWNNKEYSNNVFSKMKSIQKKVKFYEELNK